MPKILIVDDALFMREVIRSMLEPGGYPDLLEAGDGEAALRLFADERPDLVLLDITMPGMDGLEILRRMLALRPEAKVVMCSAIGQERLMMNAIRMGAAEYVVKPFRAEGLLGVIGRVAG